MDANEAAERVAAARAAMQKTTRDNEAWTLRSLEAYVRNREASFKAFNRLDPESRQTREALALLEKARRDLAQLTEG
jgi:hypothetical protein